MRQHERVGAAMSHAEARAEGVRQRVIHPYGCVGKRQRRKAGGIVHHTARLFILRVFKGDGGQIRDGPLEFFLGNPQVGDRARNRQLVE